MSQGSLITEMLHPFGRAFGTTSSLSTGVQYGNVVSTTNATTSQLSTTYQDVETASILLPSYTIIKELEIGLTVGTYIISTTTDTIIVQGLIKDSGQSSYDTLLISTAGMAASTGGGTTGAYDYTLARRVTPSDGTYFTGKSSFDVTVQLKCSATTSKAAVANKNSSYLMYSYQIIG